MDLDLAWTRGAVERGRVLLLFRTTDSNLVGGLHEVRAVVVSPLESIFESTSGIPALKV